MCFVQPPHIFLKTWIWIPSNRESTLVVSIVLNTSFHLHGVPFIHFCHAMFLLAFEFVTVRKLVRETVGKCSEHHYGEGPVCAFTVASTRIKVPRRQRFCPCCKLSWHQCLAHQKRSINVCQQPIGPGPSLPPPQGQDTQCLAYWGFRYRMKGTDSRVQEKGQSWVFSARKWKGGVAKF